MALCSWPLTAKGGSLSHKCWVCVQAYFLLDPRNSRPRGRHGGMSYLIFFRFLTFILHFWWLRRQPSWRFLYTIGVDACLVFLAWMACLFSLRVLCSHRQGNGPMRWYPTGLSEVPISRLLAGFNFVSLLNFSQWSRCIELFNLHLFYSDTKHFFHIFIDLLLTFCYSVVELWKMSSMFWPSAIYVCIL